VDCNSLEELQANPNKYGLPTFEQFRQNPGRWRMPKDIMLQKVDEGSQTLLRVRKHLYFARLPDGREIPCGDSIARCEKTLKDAGFDILKCKLKPELVEDHSTGIIVKNYFCAPTILEALGIYVPGVSP
jgi:hypothetical protein